MIVSPRLDPTEPQAFAGVRTTVALSMLVAPGVQDLVATQYLDAWLGSPWLPLYDERFSCSHCYGAPGGGSTCRG